MPPPIPLVTKIKAQLKLAIARLRMVQKRDESTSKAARRAMAQLLEAGKSDSARIRVENIIRSDIITELHELLELYCELLLARAGLLDAPVCDPGLEEAVKSIIYAAPKTEIKELQAVRALLGEKYGKEFVLAAMDNSGGAVSEKVVKKLRVTPPRPELVQGYLEEIAKAYGVDWPPGRLQSEAAVGEPPKAFDADDVDADADGAGSAGGDEHVEEVTQAGSGNDTVSTTTPSKPRPAAADLFQATPPPRTLKGPTSPLTVAPPRMTTDNIHPKVTLNSLELKPNKKMEAAAATRKRAINSDDKGGVEDLEKRFAALKKLGP